jgi:hypothetical protein
VNVIDELRVALIPVRRRVSFLLGGAVSSFILRGDSKTECLLKEVVVDGLDDDDPFFLVKRLVAFFHMVVALSLTNIYPGFSTGNKVHKYYLESGLRVELGWILLDETNSKWKAKSKVVLNYKLKHTNKELGK